MGKSTLVESRSELLKTATIHEIESNDPMFTYVDNLCLQAKNLHNCAIFNLRQKYCKLHLVMDYDSLLKACKQEHTKEYTSLPSEVSDEVIKMARETFKTFGELMSDYLQNPDKYDERPLIPRYKRKNGSRVPVRFTGKLLNLDSGDLCLTGNVKIQLLDLKSTNLELAGSVIKEVRIVPNRTKYRVDIDYTGDTVQRVG